MNTRRSSTPATATWIVTGGAGFIGSNLVREILRERPEVRVVVLDKLTYAGHLANLEDLRSGARFELVRADIARQKDVAAAFEAHRPQCILNLAAESHVDRSIDDPADFIETNIRGTFELLEASRAYHARLTRAEQESFRFLQVSTDEVYGSLGPEGHFREDTPYAPNSPYSASKASADLLVRAYHQTYGLPTLTTNCSNNYGPYQLPEKLIPLMTLNALDGEPLPIYGDGTNVRDWIYVEDHCAGILRALEDGRPGESYVFGGDSERSNLEVVDGICEALERLRPAAQNPALEKRGLATYSDLKTFVEDRPGHDQRYAIDAGKASRELGWKPARDFEAGLAATVRWYIENDSWREAVQDDDEVRTRRGLASKPGAREGAPAA